jgi:hypothetical protein
MRERLAEELIGVSRLRDDLEITLAQQPDDALTQENIVLADHHPHGLRHSPNVLDAKPAREDYPAAVSSSRNGAFGSSSLATNARAPERARSRGRAASGSVEVNTTRGRHGNEHRC